MIPDIAAADAGSFIPAGGGDFRTASNGDVAAAAHRAAADTGAPFSALGGDFRAAGNGDVTGVAKTAADTGAAMAALGDDFRAAGNGDVTGGMVYAAADTGTMYAAGGIQAAGSSGFVGDGEIALTAGRFCFRSFNGILLYTGTPDTALDSIGPVQFDGHIPVARDLDSRLSGLHGHDITGFADIDVHTAEGHIGGGVFRCRDGDGVGGGGAAVVLGDDRGTVRNVNLCSLRYRLSAFRGVDGDITVLQIPIISKGGNRQAADEQQDQEGGYKAFGFHGGVSFRWAGFSRGGCYHGFYLLSIRFLLFAFRFFQPSLSTGL